MPDLTLAVPSCFVLATGVFDRFMEENALLLPSLSAKEDSEVVQLFAEAELPPGASLLPQSGNWSSHSLCRVSSPHTPPLRRYSSAGATLRRG
jgi:hypothetical protein